MESNNNYGGVHSPYEDVHDDTPDNDDKGVLYKLTGEDMTLDDYKNVVNPIDNYSPDRDDLPKDGLSDDHDRMGEVYGLSDDHDKDEEYTLDDNYFTSMAPEFSNTDISDVTNIDSRKPPMNAAQMILDEKMNLMINGIRIIVDRLDKIEDMLHADDD
jgi:hypothetical protein